MMEPLNIVTKGFLCGPLGIATNGYLCIEEEIIENIVKKVPFLLDPISKPSGLVGRGRFENFDEKQKELFFKQLQREDEEIIIMIKAFLKCQ